MDLPVVTVVPCLLAPRSRFSAILIVVGMGILYTLLGGLSGSRKATLKGSRWRDLKFCSNCKATATTMEIEMFHHTYSHASSNSASLLPI